MWKFIPSCIRRHRRKVFVLGGFVGGIVFLNSYLKRKFMEWESHRTAEFCDQIKRSSHFEGTMSTCDSALLSFAPKVREIVCSIVDVNPVVEQLKQNPPNKMKLWEQLKVLVFTQAFCETYAQCLLVIFLKIQMSILGGYVFSNSRSILSGETSTVSDQQQKYMSHITEFMGKGINALLIPVRSAVEDVLNSIPLNRPLKLQDMENIITAIRHTLSGDSSDFPHAACYLLPSKSGFNSKDEFLERVSAETKDILECKDFDRVLTVSIEHGISSLMDRVSECFVFLSDGKEEFVNPHDFTAPLAKIIPMMHNVFSQHEPCEPGALIQILLQQESLNTFAANIYEAFSQNET